MNDEQTSIKFDNCLCDGYDYIKENQTCSDCLENAREFTFCFMYFIVLISCFRERPR